MKTLIMTMRSLLLGFSLGLAALAASATLTDTYYHNDLAGSPVVATNASGQVVWRESYRPYGERLTNSPAAFGNRIWFTSRRQDAETGLVYLGARYYDPVAGRFVSMDPSGFDERNVHSFNRYAYANNNPYRYKDPDGRVAETIFDVISFGISVEMFRRDPTVGNFLGAAFDGVMMVVPFAPGGVGSIRAIGKGADAAADAVRGADAAADASKGLASPSKYFGSKTKEEVTEALNNKFGPAKSSREGAETFYNERTKRSFNVHEEAGHIDGKPHVDIRRRGNYEERKYMLKESE